jgi:hypothetical protein
MILVFIVLFFFVFIRSDGHILTIPYPYYNREYAINETKYIALNEYPSRCDVTRYGQEKQWEFITNGVFFRRTANRSYDGLEQNKSLAAAFHGQSDFELSDMSPQTKIMYIKNKNESYKNILTSDEYVKYEGCVRPRYKLEEYGVTLAFDMVRKLTESNTFAIQVRLPLVNKTIYHDNRWRDIQYKDDCIYDERLYLDSLNQYFKVRMDYVAEHELIPDIRSINDMKNIPGLVCLNNDSSDYFLDKPYHNEFFNNDDQFDIEDDDLLLERNQFRDYQWYAMTAFDESALPTKEAIEFYDLLASNEKRVPSSFFNDVTKGRFFNKNYNWNSIQMNYVAPLDIQGNITKIFNNENIIIQGLFAVVIPMKYGLCVSESNNYLAKSFFNDQYAMRLGSQITYDLNNYYKILCYGSWQYYFPAQQSIPAIFEGVSAYGVSPLYVKGKISWQEWYLATHLVIKYNDHMGVDLGYQYINKSSDTVVPECDTFYAINGDTQKLDYGPWSEFSHSIANLLEIHGYYYIKAWQFDISCRGLFAGKNCINFIETAVRIGIDF